MNGIFVNVSYKNFNPWMTIVEWNQINCCVY